MPLHDPDDPFFSPVTLSADGQLEGPAAPKDQRRTPESWTEPDPPRLELHTVGYRDPNAGVPQEPDEEALAHAARLRQRQQLAIAVAAIVILGAAAAFFLLASAPPVAPAGAAEASAPASDGAAAFTIQSEPPGASVFIGDEVLGTTPFLGTNDAASGQQVKVRLELRGYADWTGSVTGGRNVNLVAHLKRK